jgi:hypothetical protein
MTDRTGADMASPETSFAREGAAWSEITALGSDSYRIRLGGLLRPAWMLGVCSGLAKNNVSIDRAHARRLTHDASWIAELHVVALSGAPDPLKLPLITFAEVCQVEASAPISLRTYELIESTDHGGTLRLRFNAQDSVGLLGSLLAECNSLSLLPVEMHIETRDKEAQDCLWLATSHSQSGKPSSPTSKDKLSLDGLLRTCVQH